MNKVEEEEKGRQGGEDSHGGHYLEEGTLAFPAKRTRLTVGKWEED